MFITLDRFVELLWREQVTRLKSQHASHAVWQIPVTAVKRVTMDLPVVVTIEAGLSFLGVGVRPPTPSWGSVLNDGYSFIRNTPWLIVSGGIPLIITTLGFTFLGESLRDIFDPKLRKDI